MRTTIKKTAIVGMGALGLLYGNHIVNKLGKEAVTFVMDQKRVEKYKDATFTINNEVVDFQIASADEMTPVDLVIVAVKYTGLVDAIKVMKNCIDENTIIISVLNGISSEEIIAETYGMDNVVYTVAQGMDAMKFGNDLKYTQMGGLHIGVTNKTRQEPYDRLCEFFDVVEMHYIKEEDILYRMWCKFMLNVGVNQTCMVYSTTYSGVLTEKTAANRTMIAAMREVEVLGIAEGIALSEKEINNYLDILRTLDPNGTPSMGQDRINKKASEVEMFAGTVIRMAQKHDIAVPENQFLYDQVKLIEAEYVND